MRKALRTLRSRVGRVMRDVELQAGQAGEGGHAALLELVARATRILSQKPKDRNKLYALHAPKSSVWPTVRHARLTSSA
jgi:IS5 family transposase